MDGGDGIAELMRGIGAAARAAAAELAFAPSAQKDAALLAAADAIAAGRDAILAANAVIFSITIRAASGWLMVPIAICWVRCAITSPACISIRPYAMENSVHARIARMSGPNRTIEYLLVVRTRGRRDAPAPPAPGGRGCPRSGPSGGP